MSCCSCLGHSILFFLFCLLLMILWPHSTLNIVLQCMWGQCASFSFLLFTLVMQTCISASHCSGRLLFHHQIAVDINTLWLVSNAISFLKNFDAGTWTLAGKGNCSQMSPAPQLHVHCAGNQKLDAGLDAIFRFCQENDSRFEVFNNVALPFWLCAQASPWWLCQSGEIWRPRSQRNACRDKSISACFAVMES